MIAEELEKKFDLSFHFHPLCDQTIMDLYIPQSVSNISKTCFWLREKCSGLLECDGKVADVENVPEKGVSDFYSYWNTSYFSALCQPFVCLWLCSQPTCLQLGKVRKLLCRSDRCIMTQICSEPPSQPA